MPRLIWFFARHTLILLVLSCRGSYVIFCFENSHYALPVRSIILLKLELVTLPLMISLSWVRFVHLLAHLSRRLTRWAYSIPMVRRTSVVVVRPSVRRRPHFQTWISLKPVGQSWSNFMCSITGMGERLHKVWGQIGWKLWFLWQQKAPIDL